MQKKELLLLEAMVEEIVYHSWIILQVWLSISLVRSVSDYVNNRIMRWIEGAKEGTIIVGGNGKGEQSDQLNCPYGLSFDRDGNLYIADSYNHRIQKFEIE